MKILYNSPLSLDAPGPGRPLKAIREGLERSGHEVRVIEWTQDMGLGPEADLFRATVYDLMNGYETPRDWTPDVFLGPGGGSLVQMDQWKRLSMVKDMRYSTKFVTTWFSTHYSNVWTIMKQVFDQHQINVAPIHPFLLWRAKKEQQLTDGIIVPSKQCARTYEEVPECKGKVKIVEFGVDSEMFHPTTEPHSEFHVLYAGANGWRKGLRSLAEAWVRFKPGSNDYLDVLGSDTGMDRPSVKNWGWIPDYEVPEKFRAADVFCLPSLEEGQALAVLEAMASGLPVIITRETGVEIEEGVNGFYVGTNDPAGIRKAITTLREDPQLREKMGKVNREYAVNRPWSKFGDGVIRALEEFV